MSFISFAFLALLTATFLLYFGVPLRLRWVVLLAASLVFYVWSGWRAMIYVLVTAAIAYGVSLKIEALYNAPPPEACTDKKSLTAWHAGQKRKAKPWLVLGLVLIVGVLAATKVLRFAQTLLAQRPEGSGITFSLLVPLGISYYTFALVGYLTDIYWKKDHAERNFAKLLLYTIFFPQIVEGPIPRHRKLAPQLLEGHPFEYKRFCFGLQRGLWGLFKKIVIADRLALLTGTVFGNWESYTGLYFWVAILASAVQIYTDFSGCIDIVIGVSQCMGITLEENFKRPFYAKSAAEFWRRWHMTLGAWFKDYVCMPVALSQTMQQLSMKARRKHGATYARNLMAIVPMAVVWVLTGLWHGTGPDYLAWGCYWGVITIGSTLLTPWYKKMHSFLHIDPTSGWWAAFQMVRTFFIFCGGRLLTVPGSLAATAGVLGRMFTGFNPWILLDGSLYELGLDQKNFWLVLFAIALLWFVSHLQEKGVSIRETVAAAPLPLRWCAYYGLFFAVMIFGLYGAGYDTASFVYMNF